MSLLIIELISYILVNKNQHLQVPKESVTLLFNQPYLKLITLLFLCIYEVANWAAFLNTSGCANPSAIMSLSS